MRSGAFMANRDSAYSRSSRRYRLFRFNSSLGAVGLVVVIAAFVALVLWALDL